ncbi:MAG: metallophosphoesterase family protein [Cytophagales bacterium]|jgi:putative phosphoesterase|nr:metallophosphoesterase family protein [Cytophagales bacterium]MCA6388887.1 metallophosphoesterase family protein [Cytophagales bacterium]MCA6391117.1 metallophosphoesterase family protein [Cytophagales bacterium]MCA6397738.1 metallophosphoesterase family protein [Cytophagales bacterium]MCA6401427.1 metallophosphoesterase family protein [Cytophagales bacterium]
MRTAILSDIHGNNYALNEVLKEVRREGIREILILGDMVGYYYHPDKVLTAISEYDVHAINGNHEHLLFGLMDDPQSFYPIVKKYGSGHFSAVEKLSQEQIKWLRALPDTREVYYNDLSIMMSHGSPWANDTYVYPDSNLELLKAFDSFNYDLILIGHSHYSFCLRRGNTLVVNPGSVGQSRQKGGKAYWAILNSLSKSIEFRITDYDVTELKLEVLKNDPDLAYNYKILERK